MKTEPITHIRKSDLHKVDHGTFERLALYANGCPKRMQCALAARGVGVTLETLSIHMRRNGLLAGGERLAVLAKRKPFGDPKAN